jgi:RecA-family ATPase
VRDLKALLQDARPAAPKREAQLRPLSRIEMRRVRWLWEGYLALGKLTVLAGEPGQGKSLLSLDVAARMTTGRPVPLSTAKFERSDVLIFTNEDDAEDTIVPRFVASGGDRDRLHDLTFADGSDFDVKRDLPALEQALRANPSIKLVIFDPLFQFTTAKQNIDGEVRPILHMLKDVAKRYGVAMILICHFNKKVDISALDKIGGCKAITAVPRLVYSIYTDGEAKHMCWIKGNVSRSTDRNLIFLTKEVPLAIEGVKVGLPVVDWVGASDKTATELSPTSKATQKAKEPDNIAAGLLAELKEVEQDSKAVCSKLTLMWGWTEGSIRNAASKLGSTGKLVTRVLEPTAGTNRAALWSLPSSSAMEVWGDEDDGLHDDSHRVRY